MGSIAASLYASGLPDGAPDSLGAAVQVGGDVATAARGAFVHAMSQASVVVAIVTAVGAVIAWRYLPARRATPTQDALARRTPIGDDAPR